MEKPAPQGDFSAVAGRAGEWGLSAGRGHKFLLLSNWIAGKIDMFRI